VRNSTAAVRIIIAINIVVFLLWNYWDGSEYGFMASNFLVSWDALIAGRYWTLLTSVFSHVGFLHLFINMYAFLGFGSALELTLGTRRFVIFYLLAGIFSSLCHAITSASLLGEPALPALGASGAVAGVVMLFALIYPREKILVFFVPLPAISGAIAIVGLDVWGLVSQAEGGGLPIGHGAHLGGAFFGAMYFLRLKKARR
jgi:membrane associated rhomboid family serine protease